MRRLLALLVPLMMISGCAEPDQSSDETDFVELDLTYLLAEMEERGASGKQQEAVAEALVAGEMPFGVVADLFNDHAQCLEDADFGVSGVGSVERYPGVPMVSAMFFPPESLSFEQWSLIERDCMLTHYFFAEQYHINQPSTRDQYLQSFEDQRAFILDCLDERGMEIEPDATRLELLYAVSEADLRFPGAGVCWEGGAVFDGFLPPGTDPGDLEP